MNNEIKEILDDLRDWTNSPLDEIDKKYSTWQLSYSETKVLLDYITNLQEEIIDLRENEWAWQQIIKMQNKREYRSKFLKDFQKEHGTNTYPDYDEIYKRYDKMKTICKKAIESLTKNKFYIDLDEVLNILKEGK